jgi:hypothetical protein
VKLRHLFALSISVVLLSACSEVQEVIDTGKQVIDAAQGLNNVCTIAEPLWTTDIDAKAASDILKQAVTELESVITQNQDLVPDAKTLLQDLKVGVAELEKGLTKKELKEVASSIQSLCSGLSNQ